MRICPPARDMTPAEVQAAIDRSRAPAGRIGVIGTPGLVVGRTALNGAFPHALLRRIMEGERPTPAPVP
jgi:hypothetical protein